jgi:hypothetical protein
VVRHFPIPNGVLKLDLRYQELRAAGDEAEIELRLNEIEPKLN